MDDETAVYGTIPARIADLWVFALFEPQLYPAGDVLDSGLWHFYVVHKAVLETRIGDGKAASLSRIAALTTPLR